MNYDSEDERKMQQDFAEKLKGTRDFLKDKEKVKLVIEKVEELYRMVEPITIKVRAHEKLTDEEKEKFHTVAAMILKVKDSFEDMQLILGHNLGIQADAYYFHVKKLAEEGNDEAKKVYEELKPLYEKAHLSDSPEDKN